MRSILSLLLIFSALMNVRLSAGEALNAALLDHRQTSDERLNSLKLEGYNAVVLLLDESDGIEGEVAAARQVLASTLGLHYWIDIGRSRAIAKAHPEWMASLQTHEEWRQHFPNFPTEEKDQVVKNFPWVPVLNKEAFDAHLARTAKILAEMPAAKTIFLNHLQGGPSACGCGNSFCRWTADYGPKKTATPLRPEAASLFVAAVKKVARGAEIVPVWTTECAEHEKETACHGVPCFRGLCWKETAKQLNPLASEARRIGVLLTSNDLPAQPKPQPEWQTIALKSFSDVLPKNGGTQITSDRLVAVLQNWEGSAVDLRTQRKQCASVGVTNVIVALTKLESSWEPRLLNLRR